MGCDDAKIAGLNGDFRDKPQATNVLSWPSEERAAQEEGVPRLPDATFDPELGDIAISYDTPARSRAGKIAPQHHVTHLIVHAMLHLLGYDHIRDQDATLMEGIEIEILAIWGSQTHMISKTAKLTEGKMGDIDGSSSAAQSAQSNETTHKKRTGFLGVYFTQNPQMATK